MNVSNVLNANCQGLRFRPGDRIIVRVNQKIDKKQQVTLKKTIEDWAGPGVVVLIVQLPLLDLQVEHNG